MVDLTLSENYMPGKFVFSENLVKAVKSGPKI